MTSMLVKSVGLGLALLSTCNAFALGLGEAAGQPILGQPLRLEIPLLGSGGNLPAATCFSIRPPVTDVGSEFTLQSARIQVVGERGGARLIVTSVANVREPIVAFSVAAGCAFGFAKDYILLSAMPAETPPALVAPAPAETASPVATKPVVERPVAAASAAQARAQLRVDSAITLEGLAREKYPMQPKARAKFMRMMLQANPDLRTDGGLIAAGTELKLPAGLPLRRIGPYLGESKAAPTQPAASMPAVPQPAAQGPMAVSRGKDRLVLGAAPQQSEAALLAEAERLTAILIEQNKTQDAMLEKLAVLEGNYGQLQKNFAQLQDRLARIEAERLAEKQAQNSPSVDFVELLLAVLAGGAIGGVALHIHQRRLAQRDAEAAPPADTAATVAAKLPWTDNVAVAAPKAAAPTTPVLEESATPDVAVAASEDDKPYLIDFFPEAADPAEAAQQGAATASGR